MRRGPVTPRSGPAFTGSRFPTKARNGGLRRTSGFAAARLRAAPAVAAGDVVPELKFHDVDLDDAAIDTGGTVTPTINIIAQGTTESTRIGRKCAIRNINWRYRMSLAELDAGGSPNNGDVVRVIMYLDKQANKATAAVTDLLESANFQSFNQLANKGRFRVLHDKVYDMNYLTLASDNAGVVSSAQVQMSGEFYAKCNIPIEYDNSATDGSIGTITSNNLGVLLIGATGAAGFDSKIRLRFSDA